MALLISHSSHHPIVFIDVDFPASFDNAPMSPGIMPSQSLEEHTCTSIRLSVGPSVCRVPNVDSKTKISKKTKTDKKAAHVRVPLEDQFES